MKASHSPNNCDATAALSTARELDAVDPLRSFRDQFNIPASVYLCGNSLGAMPKRTEHALQTHISKWATAAVDGHFNDPQPWALIEEEAARLSLPIVGAAFPHEVAVMNSLTVNLHNMLTAFYKPTKTRCKILIEQHAFPSDMYALQTHISARGYNPDICIIRLTPRPGEHLLHEQDMLSSISAHANELALILLPGVQYYTGQLFPMPQLTKHAHAHNIPIGFDLAHAVGNVPLHLHNWDIDFAVWCNYKYLNSGPGAVGGVFLHHRHADANLPRHAGWWGHDRKTRFSMPGQFLPQKGARGFQSSNPPVMAIIPVIESLKLFKEAGGVPSLNRKSAKLTAFLEQVLLETLHDDVDIISPEAVDERGCQLSLRLTRLRRRWPMKKVNDELGRQGIVCDVREPDVLRVAPTPLYNSFEDVYTFVHVLKKVLRDLHVLT